MGIAGRKRFQDAEANRAFTLLEVILAISLTGVVLMLLATALDLLLHRVETSRSRVETSQLARAILNQMAGDLRAVRYDSPAHDSGSTEEGTEEDTEEETEGSSSESTEDSETDKNSPLALGIYGSATQLRIDRSAVWNWNRIAQDDDRDTATDATAGEMPRTVRYFLGDGDRVLAGTFAAGGVLEEDATSPYAGLSRQQMSTAAWVAQPDVEKTEKAVLLAPEVLDLEFAYFDGEELLDHWNTDTQGGLPHAIEITLKLAKDPLIDLSRRPTDDAEESLPRLEDALAYRLFVRLPNVKTRTKVPGPKQVQQ